MTIICFGDSLTRGYQSPTPDAPYYHCTPYGNWLQQWLGEKASVLVRGLNGELTSEMIGRFDRDVRQDNPQYVIILGGTNDLSSYIEPTDVFRNLVMLYEQSMNASICPIAVTVPSLRMEGEHDRPEFLTTHIEPRVNLNRSIQSYCLTSNIPCVDLFSKTLEIGSSLLDPQYSNDGLHLSTQGYKLLAQLLWDRNWASHDRRSQKRHEDKTH